MDTNDPINVTKLDLPRELPDEEMTQNLRAAGSLAWVSTGTSPTSACLAIMTLKGKKKTLLLLQGCREAYAKIPASNLASLRYVPLDFDTINIPVISAGSFQNLPDKH